MKGIEAAKSRLISGRLLFTITRRWLCRNSCNQAFTQLCAVYSPFYGSMSAIGMLRQQSYCISDSPMTLRTLSHDSFVR